MRTAELLVSEVEPIPGGVVLRGVVNRGATALGDVVGGLGPQGSSVAEGALQVKRITTYRRTVDFLPEGMTGELRCEGAVEETFLPGALVVLTSGAAVGGLSYRREILEAKGRSFLVVRVGGVCRHDGMTETIASASRAALERHPSVDGAVVVVEGASCAACAYLSELDPVGWAWVAGGKAGKAIATRLRKDQCRMPSEWLFEDVQAAVRELGRRRDAGEVRFHAPDGSLQRVDRWEPRGHVITTFGRERGVRTETEELWSDLRRVHVVTTDKRGVRHSTLFPFPDGTGARNEACSLSAVLWRERQSPGLALVPVLLDLRPEATGVPRSATWLASLERVRGVRKLDLSGTETTDADVEEVLRRCEQLTSLWLARTAITQRALARLAEVAELRHVDVTGCRLPLEALDAVDARRPGLFRFDRGVLA